MLTAVQNSVFPILITILTYQLGLWIQKKVKWTIFSPVLFASLVVIGILVFLELPIEQYEKATEPIRFLIPPATIALAIPMYEQFTVLRKHIISILIAVLAGTITSLIVVALLAHAFSLSDFLRISLMPKSVTSAIGVPLADSFGGDGSITAVIIIITGIIGSMVGELLCRIFRINDSISKGVAYGTAAHVIGTGKANEISELVGAVSSLSLIVAGMFTAILFPFAMKYL